MRGANSTNVNAKAMNLDGAGDMPDHHFGLDGAPGPYKPQQDDRTWEYIRGGSRNGAPTIGSPRIYSGPPPPLSQTSFELPGSLLSSNRITGSVRYGSGPVPSRTRTTSIHGPAPSIQGSPALHTSFDPNALDQALANMAKRSSDRYYQTSSQSSTIPLGALDAPSSHIPGSWPEPDRAPVSAFAPAIQDSEGLAYPPAVAVLGLQSDLQGTEDSWHQRVPGAANWDDVKGWESGGEEQGNPSIRWDGGNTWGTPQEWNTRTPYESEGVHEQFPTGWDAPTAQTSPTDHRTQSSDFHSARSRPTVTGPEIDTDGEGWTHVGAISDSSGSWIQPVQPSESISHVAGPSLVASVADQDPLVKALRELLSSNKDEGSQKRSVATGLAASLALSVPFADEGFSTFERSVRGAVHDGKSASVWDVQKSELAPKRLPALEREGISPSLLRVSDNGHETVHGHKSWSKPGTDVSANVWAGKETVRPAVDGASLLRDDLVLSKADWTNEKGHGGTVKGKSWDIPSGSKDLQDSDTSWQADINGWSAPQKADSVLNETNPWITPKEIESRSAKTRLAKYRQLRSPVTGTSAKGQRQFPPSTPDAKNGTRSGMASHMAAEPLVKVSKEDAANQGVQHQIRAGEGSRYGHAIGRPEYLDNLEKPVST